MTTVANWNDRGSLDSSVHCLTLQETAKKWSPLQSFIQNGKIDLGDPLALTEYNRALLYLLTGYRIEIPDGNLVPAVCLRYTYLKYLRDRFSTYKQLIDVGTGASAIMALISQFLGFEVFATEINSESIYWAKRNLEQNNLSFPIFKSEGGLLKEVVPKEILKGIDVAVTYPPFYPKDIPGRTSKKGRGFKGTDSELFGGATGFEFTNSYLMECCELQIPLPTVLLHKKEFAKKAIALFSTDYSTEIIPVKAGTRQRYIVLGLLRR